MKNLTSLSIQLLSKSYFYVILILCICCTDPVQEELAIKEAENYQGVEEWQERLDAMIYENSIIVEQGNSIQEAINAAKPGETIFVEAGVYKEVLTIDKAKIKLIGIESNAGEKVILENPGNKDAGIRLGKLAGEIEIRNVELQHFTDNSLPSNLKPSTQIARHYRRCKIKRASLGGNIAHYKFEIRLGNGEYDKVRIHRVVKEKRDYRPARTKSEVFMIHGGSQDFDDIFLTAGAFNNINAQTSSPYYLASKGIDVWGIDLAWTMVPEETSDFSFMENWGVEKDAEHTLSALSIARLIRGLTGQGFGRLNVLGFSYGVPVAYTAAGIETQQHPLCRNIKGLIPVEAGMKYDESDPTASDLRSLVCEQAAGFKATLEGGTYNLTQGIDLAPIGNLAVNAPNDDFPLPFPIPDLTNSQVAIAVGALPNLVPAPLWHFVAGEFDENGVPLGLAYTENSRWFNLLTTLAPYMPIRTVYEFRACQCDEEEVSIDDYLDQISVPILYLGAGGGFGDFGIFTSSLTASTDITDYTADFKPDSQRAFDYGHADVFMAKNAPEEVWKPLSQWLMAHHAYSL
ncbi:hypothetical protein OKW21_003407 [Catalinimonas alkaloidigena]|uniref:hypothetical protein n=1 Tax=Catalinimonas alkaloidigena TaxID=1075417 RepID=UPI002404F0EA|nr:hypothetical protein [Catalinimonas alkaloidigena]MDF9798144.1 hypothetical protein [Catalinimonas alkaloidigena]